MVNPIRVAFVGAGRRSLQSARMLAGSGIGVPVGFWNRTAETARAAAEEFAATADERIESLIERTGPDLVAIMTHPSARVEPVRAAAAAGARAILIEKPIALSPEELAEVERAAGDAFVTVNTQYQWMPHWQRYLADIAAGRLGEIRGIRASVGVDLLEQGPHALSLAMAAAAAGRLADPGWVIAGADGRIDFGGVAVPADTTALFDLGSARLFLTAGSCAPDVPGETVRAFQQQTEIVGSEGRIWVSLNQGSAIWLPAGHEDVPTRWERDDLASQTGLFAAIAAALADPGLRPGFPTRLAVAARQARMLFGAIRAARLGARVRLD
jgi:predicted dehydrogenase